MGHADQEKLSRSISQLRLRLNRSMTELAKSQLSMLQVSIVQELLSGRRTVAELVEAIYTVRQGDAGYGTLYSRVRREIRQMESEGLVARRLFGRDKPYTLTQLAVARLTMIEGVKPDSTRRVITRTDLIVYITVLALGVTLGEMTMTKIANPMVFLLLAFVFVFTGGISFCRFLQILRRVM